MTDYAVSAGARISLPSFAGYLASRGSPAAGDAAAIYDRCCALGIDPAVALAFFDHESACGTRGRALATKSWGNLRYLAIYQGHVPYAIANVDGFCAYGSFIDAVDHFCRHLVGLDGTNNYEARGLLTVSQVVPVWAPTSDGNTPGTYIAAVNGLVDQLTGGKAMTKPRVLLIAGHLRCEQITEDGLCDNLDKAASAARLRTMTGSFGERDYTGDFVARLESALNATGRIEARASDCVYHKDLYVDWKPTLVHAFHYHRDAPAERAMFAAPDQAVGFHSAAANAESRRLVDRIVGGYTAATGIPVTQDVVTINMRQLYTWCFIDTESQAAISELGNANLDASVLYNDIGKLVTFHRDCHLEHLNLTPATDPPPARRATDTPPSPPKVTRDVIASQLEGIAQQVRQLA